MSHSLPYRQPHPRIVAFAVFLLAAVCAASLIWRLAQDERQDRRARASALVIEHAHSLQQGIERALSATCALEALLHQGKGSIAKFDAMGSQLVSLYPGAISLSLAPEGVIRRIVPLTGNERALDTDLLTYAKTKKEASIAPDTGKLTLTGPLKLAKGTLAAIGRLPVFLDSGAQGRGDPDRSAHHGSGGCRRGDVLAPALPRRAWD